MPGEARQQATVGWNRWFAAVLLLLALGTMGAGCGWGRRAAGPTGRITGTITDGRTGAPLGSVVVIVDGVAYRTVAGGVYATNPLPYGTHQVKVESPGFYPQTASVNLASAIQTKSFSLDVIPDSTTPMVLSTTPSSGATGVYVDSALVIRFSEPMDQASVKVALQVAPNASLKFTWDGNSLIVSPEPEWLATTPYTVTLGTGASDVTGNGLAAPVTVTFTTGSTRVPRAAFASSGDDPYGQSKLYLLNPEIPQAATLFSVGEYEDEEPAWSPDGSRLVFVSKRGTPRRHLFVTGVTAFSPQPLLSDSAWDDIEPKWSPEGGRIAFTSNRFDVSGGDFDIYVVGVDPSTGQANQATLKQVTVNPNWDSNPEWSPEVAGPGGLPLRDLLVFSSNRAGERWIYAVDVEDNGGAVGELAGDPVSLLTPNDAGADYPAWSPDGTMIAYTSARNGTKDIWVMDVTVTAGSTGRVVTASNHRRLTIDAASDSYHEEQPAWSPDGKYLLFVRYPAFGGNPDVYRLEVANPAAPPVLMAGGLGRQTNPAWSRR